MSSFEVEVDLGTFGLNTDDIKNGLPDCFKATFLLAKSLDGVWEGELNAWTDWQPAGSR